MLPKRIECFLKVFDAFGFNTQATSLSNGQKLSHSINWTHILIAVLLIINEVIFFSSFYYYYGLYETLNEIVECSASLCGYWLIIFDSLLYRRAHRRFWMIFQRINKPIHRHSNVIPRSYVIKIVEFYTANILISCISWQTLPGSSFLSYVIYIFPIKICQLRLFYYVFCLEIVLYEMKMLQNEIKHMDNIANCCSNADRMDPSSSFESHRIKWARKYDSIEEMVNLLNEIFGFSQVGTVLFCFYVQFTDLNYFYIHFDELKIKKAIG